MNLGVRRTSILAAGILALLASPAAKAQTAGRDTPGALELKTSDQALAAAFEWARGQALACAFSGDPVGLWYEAALPGREAFCMRDVSHQAMGAHMLGLAAHTRNMLHKFAAAVSDSRDWCSFWEINRYDRPAPVDYRNDAEFWYNLPANFDVLDCCYRMYLWSGDRSYLDDPAFVNFYRRTVEDYARRWDLEPERIMSRQRILNVRGRPDPQNRFQTNRGIPSYEESRRDFTVAADLLAAEYAGYLAYARIQQLRGHDDEAAKSLAKAEKVKALLNGAWWDPEHPAYYSYVSFEGKLREPAANAALLYYGATERGEKTRATVDGLVRRVETRPPGIEGQSHLPEILYRYGMWDAAYRQILDIASPQKPRREYPEASYAVVGAIAAGLMGIGVEPAQPSEALTWDLYVDRSISTLPRLTPQTLWAELDHVPVRNNRVRVRHDGLKKTVLVNEGGPALFWKACLPGSLGNLLVDGHPAAAEQTAADGGRKEVSCVRVAVGAGESRTVAAPE